MKTMPRLLSCLLVASVAMLNSSATIGDVPASKRQIKSPSKGEVKRARQARAEKKNVVKTAIPVSAAQPTVQPATPPVTQAATQSAAQPATQSVAQATLKPAARSMPASVPGIATAVAAPEVMVVNPYSPGAFAVNKGAAVNPYLPKPAIAAVPAPTQPISLAQAPAAPAPAKAGVPPAPVVTAVPIVAPTPAPVVVAAPVKAPAPIAAKTVVEPEAAPPVAVSAPVQPIPTEVASAKAWAKIVAGPAAAPVASAASAASAVASANPYLTYRTSYTQAAPIQAAPAQAAPRQAVSAPISSASLVADSTQLLNSVRNFLPDLHLPSPDIDVLPSITKVFPTGERPMYVLTFKCPTELVGITPPPTKALRWLITSGMESINSTNLLPFSMQQVCQ